LSGGDLDDMAALAGATRPGPFLRHTPPLGSYLGIKKGGRLVAMAGERVRPPGFTEISTVCTHPGFRGQGLARRLTQAVAAGIEQRRHTDAACHGHQPESLAAVREPRLQGTP
jgi:ribosomal protein S18 acetylase RimI-like enzyme